MEKSSTPIPSHLQNFLDWLDVEKGLSTKSQENYARFLKRFLDWIEANKLKELKPHELTPIHIRNYRLFLSRTHSPRSSNGLKKSTQNYYLIALRSLLNYFTDHDIISLPAEKIKLARDKDERQIRFLSLSQLEKLFAVPDTSIPTGLRDRAILEVFFSTGMRIAELVALNQDQIKPPPGTGDLELSIVGKGRRIRTVYFSERALSWLKRYLSIRKDSDLALFVNTKRGDAAGSLRLSPRSIEKSFKRYALRAGLSSHTTPHAMRHSFATDLLGQGVDLRTIQEFLGHKSITATQIYAHVTSKKLWDVHRKFHSGRK